MRGLDEHSCSPAEAGLQWLSAEAMNGWAPACAGER